MSKTASRKQTAGSTRARSAGGEGGADSAEAEGLSFEGALEKLETTVGQLEEGELPLEQALDLFEQGVALSRRCSTTLEAAERRIEVLVADRDDPESLRLEPFEDDDLDEEDEEEE